ncbi:MAG: type II secretion system protein [Phycisphaerales bacterium]
MNPRTNDRTYQSKRAMRNVACGAPAPRGFSLVELLVVISIAMALMSVLMPALRSVRDHTDRMISASNMRQIGISMSMYSTDNMGWLPYSALLREEEGNFMSEMMATYIGIDGYLFFRDGPAPRIGANGFEGLGLLYQQAYTSPDIFYSPSHSGDHSLERYADMYLNPPDIGVIYGNYHYRGDIDPFDRNRRLNLVNDANRVFVTDGMRTRRDLNHEGGFNILRGDGSVSWRADPEREIFHLLPEERNLPGGADVPLERIWQFLDTGE